MMEYALYLSWIGFWKVTINEKQPYINIVKEVQLTNLGLLMAEVLHCLLYTSPSPRDLSTSRMPSSA